MARGAAAVARDVAAELPELVTDRMPQAERAGRVLIDVRQNARRLMTVAPYSLRAAVSTPLMWDEIDAAVAMGDTGRLVFEAPEALARLRTVGDPLAAAATIQQTLPRARSSLSD